MPRMKSSTPIRRFSAPLALLLVTSLAGCGVIGGGHKHVKSTPTVGNRIPILSRVESGAKVDPDLAAVAVVLPPPEANAEWAQPGGAPNKSYGHLALGDAPARMWSAVIAGSSERRRLAAAPVIGGGAMFVMDTSGVLHAFDAGSGREKWTHSFSVAGEDQQAVFGGG